MTTDPSPAPSRRSGRLTAIALLVLGLTQMAGDMLELPWLKGLGTVSVASPAPKVFSSAKGFETFSATFSLAWRDNDGEPHTLVIDHTIYPRLKGPYNRRNVWGAALAYGPVLATTPATLSMFHEVTRHGLCGQDAPLLIELGLDPSQMRDVAVVYTTRPGGNSQDLPLTFHPRCT